MRDKEISEKIRGSVMSSPELRDKADLIDAFLVLVGFGDAEAGVELAALPEGERHDHVAGRWRAFIEESMNTELDRLIEEQNPKPDETRALVSKAFEAGSVPEEGTAVSTVLKPVSRFAKGNPHGERRQRALDALTAFYERFSSFVREFPAGR